VREFLDHYAGGILTILLGIGLTAFGVWERLPGEARSAFVMSGISLVGIGAGVFNVERKQRRMETKIDTNTQMTAAAADAATVAVAKAETAVGHAEEAAVAASTAAEEAAQSRRMP
jgi:hypothetical protein